MFGIGANELLLILLFGFLIFGPDKLPQVAKTLGQAIGKFRDAQNEMNGVLKDSLYDPSSTEGPFKNPLDAAAKVDKKVQEKKVQAEKQVESFSERKARYDKEREARRKADLEAEKRSKEQAKAAAAAVGTGAAKPEAEKPETAPAPAIDIDELYGAKPAPADAKPTAADEATANTAKEDADGATAQAAPEAASNGEGE